MCLQVVQTFSVGAEHGAKVDGIQPNQGGDPGDG